MAPALEMMETTGFVAIVHLAASPASERASGVQKNENHHVIDYKEINTEQREASYSSASTPNGTNGISSMHGTVRGWVGHPCSDGA